MDVINTLGRRKTSVARIYMKKGKGNITINGRELKDYFSVDTLVALVHQPLKAAKSMEKYDIKANIKGGGTAGQARALQLAIARALVEIEPEIKPALRAEELMTRDPRMVERKKPGQKKARKRFQFSKR